MADRTLISQLDSELLGLPRFFTGKKCGNGHLSERYVANGGCITCSASYRKTYYTKNKESLAEYQKEYQSKNRAALNEKSRIYYAENREKISKYVKLWNKKKNQ